MGNIAPKPEPEPTYIPILIPIPVEKPRYNGLRSITTNTPIKQNTPRYIANYKIKSRFALAFP